MQACWEERQPRSLNRGRRGLSLPTVLEPIWTQAFPTPSWAAPAPRKSPRGMPARPFSGRAASFQGKTGPSRETAASPTVAAFGGWGLGRCPRLLRLLKSCTG